MRPSYESQLIILLIDDDLDDSLILRNMLSDRVYLAQNGETLSYQIDWADTFAAGLEALRSRKYDVGLVDYSLGVENGLDLLRLARQEGIKTPLIILTGNEDTSIDAAAARAGAADYLVKQYLTALLLERSIRFAIQREHTEQQLKMARDTLEMRVQKRTQELQDLNTSLQNEIEERIQIELALLQTRRELEERLQELLEQRRAEIQARMAAAQAREQADELSAMFRAMNEAVIVFDPQLMPLRANAAALASLGLDPATSLTEQSRLHRESLRSLAPYVRRALQGESVRNEHLALPGPQPDNGASPGQGQMQVLLSASPIYARPEVLDQEEPEPVVAGVVTVWHDITERETLIDQIEAERARLSAIIANAPGALLVADLQGQVLLSNVAAEQLFGPVTLEKKLEEQSRAQICHLDGTPYDKQELPLTRSALQGETQINLEVGVRQQNGRMRYALVNSAPIIDRNGRISGAIALFQDITKHKREEAEAQRQRTQLEVQRRLIQSREEERLRIARELHDGPIQELVATTFTINELQLLQQQLLFQIERNQETASLATLLEMREKASELMKDVQGQVRSLRTFTSEMRPPTLVTFGLAKAIESHQDEFAKKFPKFHIHLDLMADHQLIPNVARLALFRIYQEALNNIARHAGTQEAFVSLRLDSQRVVLEIQDRGVGFTLPGEWVDLARQGHLGLVGVQERATAVGGHVEVDSHPGAGTLIRATVPIQAFEMKGLFPSP